MAQVREIGITEMLREGNRSLYEGGDFHKALGIVNRIEETRVNLSEETKEDFYALRFNACKAALSDCLEKATEYLQTPEEWNHLNLAGSLLSLALGYASRAGMELTGEGKAALGKWVHGNSRNLEDYKALNVELSNLLEAYN